MTRKIKIENIKDRLGNKDRFIEYGWKTQNAVPNSLPYGIKIEQDLLDENKNFFFTNGGEFEGFIALDESDNVVGRVGAMLNPGIQRNDQLGLIGLFHSINDYEVARLLLEKAKSWLKDNNCKRIWGPIDFNMWYRYRFAVDSFSSKTFLGEPRNPDYYPEFFEKFGFEINFRWQTILMDRSFLEAYFEENQEQLELFERSEYSVLLLDESNFDEMLDLIYTMLIDAYKNLPIFSSITKTQFKENFRYLTQFVDEKCTRLYKDPEGKFIGFFLILKDISALANPETELIDNGYNNTNKGPSLTANMLHEGFIPGALREGYTYGEGKFGKTFSLSRIAHCKALEVILPDLEYKDAIGSLVLYDANIKNHFDDNLGKRNYCLYELKI